MRCRNDSNRTFSISVGTGQPIDLNSLTAPTQSIPVSPSSRIPSRLLAAGLLAAVSAIYASLRMFSGFSFYDDEGSLILMSRWLMDGHSVYGEFNSIYGPFYFLYVWTAHTLLGGSASHTTARLPATGATHAAQ